MVLRSTVLPGTAETIVVPTLEKASGKPIGRGLRRLRQSGVHARRNGSGGFLGAGHDRHRRGRPSAHSALVRELYAWAPGRMFETSFRSAEMVKYVCNAWHAVKVAFANEVGTLARELEVDAESVMEIFTSDTKLNISPSLLEAGIRFRRILPA